MSPDKLIYMANQIGKFFTSQGPGAGGGGDGRSHAEILGPAYACEQSSRISRRAAPGLDPVVRLAVERLKDAQKKKPEKPGVE